MESDTRSGDQRTVLPSCPVCNRCLRNPSRFWSCPGGCKFSTCVTCCKTWYRRYLIGLSIQTSPVQSSPEIPCPRCNVVDLATNFRVEGRNGHIVTQYARAINMGKRGVCKRVIRAVLQKKNLVVNLLNGDKTLHPSADWAVNASSKKDHDQVLSALLERCLYRFNTHYIENPNDPTPQRSDCLLIQILS